MLDDSNPLFHQCLRLVNEHEVLLVFFPHLIESDGEIRQSAVRTANLVEQSAALCEEESSVFGVWDRLRIEPQRVVVATVSISHYGSRLGRALTDSHLDCV